MAFALSGVRILCVAGQYPGPFATMVLSDLGADVVLVERPQGGDPGRLIPTFFNSLNRNKRSLAIDLKRPGGREALKQVAGWADVVLEGFRPGTMARLGLDYESLSAGNERLIYASVSGFGQDGPYRDRAAHDLSYQAVSGNLFRHARSGKTEIYPEVATADLLSGSFAAIGILSALLGRERTGLGTYVDVSMTDSLVAANAILLAPVLNRGEPPNIMEEPAYGLFRCKGGGMISLSNAYEDWFWDALCRAVQLEEGVGLDRNERLARKVELREKLEAIFLTGTRAEWEERLGAGDVLFGPVLDLEEVVNDPHHLARNLFTKISGDAPGDWFVRQPLRMSGWEGAPTKPVPRLGEHTVEVLREAGLGVAQIRELLRDGVVTDGSGAA